MEAELSGNQTPGVLKSKGVGDVKKQNGRGAKPTKW